MKTVPHAHGRAQLNTDQTSSSAELNKPVRLCSMLKVHGMQASILCVNKAKWTVAVERYNQKILKTKLAQPWQWSIGELRQCPCVYARLQHQL